MNKWKNRIAKYLSIMLASILLWSSFVHIGNQMTFVETVFQYQIFPPSVSIVIGKYFPFFQAIVAGYLLLEILTPLIYWVTASIFASFFALQSVTLFRGLQIDCGCFGVGDETISLWSLAIAFAFFACSCLVIVLCPKEIIAGVKAELE